MNDSRDAIRIIRVWVENAITNVKKPGTYSFLLKGKILPEDSIYRIRPTEEINESNWKQISEIEDLQEIAKGELYYVEQSLIFKGAIDIEPNIDTATENYLFDLRIRMFFSLNPFLNHCYYFIEEMDA